MPNVRIVSDISQGIKYMLEGDIEKYVSKGHIFNCDPIEEICGSGLSVHLYDIKIISDNKSKSDSNFDPTKIYLYYMIFHIGEWGAEERAFQSQPLIERVMKISGKYKTVPEKFMPSNLPIVPIAINNIDLREKAEIWKMYEKPYKVSVYCKVGPISILKTDKDAIV